MSVHSEQADFVAFIDNAELYWSEMRSTGAAAANRRVRKQLELVAQWAEQGQAAANLRQLISNPSSEVNLSAAAHLIDHGGRDEAISVLLALAKDPDNGFLGPSAAAVLRIHGVTQSLQ